MAVSDVDIYNLALSHVGSQRFIAAFTDSGREAKVGTLWYDRSRDFVLNDFPWGFAQKYKALGLIESSPNSDWSYKYEYPSDCLSPRRILSGVGRVEVTDVKIPYSVANDDTGRVIFTDMTDAVLQYTQAVTDPNLFSEQFIDALSFRIAMNIAMPLSMVKPTRNELVALYTQAIDAAKRVDVNESREDAPPDSEFISARL